MKAHLVKSRGMSVNIRRRLVKSRRNVFDVGIVIKELSLIELARNVGRGNEGPAVDSLGLIS